MAVSIASCACVYLNNNKTCIILYSVCKHADILAIYIANNTLNVH